MYFKIIREAIENVMEKSTDDEELADLFIIYK